MSHPSLAVLLPSAAPTRGVAFAALVSSCLFLIGGSPAVANDTNRTGQTQSNDSGKSGTASKGGNADTMGGGNATAMPPSQQPQQAPPSGAQSPGEAKTNAESNAPQTNH